MRNQACSGNERLSKNTFLALLGSAAFKKPTTYGNKELYYYKGQEYTTQVSENYSSNRIRSYFEKLDLNNWSIRSFDSTTKKVCIEIRNKSGTRNLSVTLPSLISKEV